MGELKIKLFEGNNYIYIKDEYNNHLCAEFVIKNDFTDEYVTNLQMSSAIEHTARVIDLSVSKKLEGYSTVEETKAEIEILSDKIDSTVKGIKEEAIKNVDVMYALSTSETTAPTTGWSTTAPQWEQGKYMWQKTITTLADDTVKESEPTCISGAKGDKGEQGIQGLQGEKGEQGIAGKDGISGKTSYFHIKYSSVENPTSSSQMSETPNTYIGTYVDFTEADSTDPSKYTWTRFQGLQGAKGEQGIPGTNGVNGTSHYLHIKYSNNGTTFTSNNGETVGEWIGVLTDTNVNDSNVFSDYKWSKIKGNTGIGVKKIVEQYYLSTSKTSQTGGEWKTGQDTWTSGKYFWTRSQITWTDNSVTYTDPVLATNTNEAFSKIEQTREEITQEVGKKVNNSDFGTKITQNAEYVQIAWNQISDFIQFINAQLQIKDNNKKKLMALAKDGQHFYKSNGEEIGKIGLITDSSKNTLIFGLNYKNENDGMAWGITDSNGVFYPVFQMKGFDFTQDSEYGGYLEMVGDLYLGGYSTIHLMDSILSGDLMNRVLMEQTNNFQITDTSDTTIFSVSDGNCNLANKLSIYSNQLGTYTLKFGECMLTDDGKVICYDLIESSRESVKKNINEYTQNATEIVKNSKIHTFNYKKEKDTDKKHIGFIIGDEGNNYNTPEEVISQSRDGVDTYKMTSILWKAVQEQQEIIENLKERLDKLEAK